MPHPRLPILPHLLQRRAVGEEMAVVEAVVLPLRLPPSSNQGPILLRAPHGKAREEMALVPNFLASTISTVFVAAKDADAVILAPLHMAPRILKLITRTWALQLDLQVERKGKGAGKDKKDTPPFTEGANGIKYPRCCTSFRQTGTCSNETSAGTKCHLPHLNQDKWDKDFTKYNGTPPKKKAT